MKQISDFKWILVMLPCCLGTIWATAKFCKSYLKISRRNEALFWGFFLCGWITISFVCNYDSVPYIVFAFVEQIFFIMLVQALFLAEQEKKLFASSLLILVTTLLKAFCESLLSCAVLLFMHTAKNVAEPVVDEGASFAIAYFGYFVVIGGVYWMSKHLASVFYGKKRKWYLMLAIPLLVIIVVFDIAKWGASKGILLRSGGNFNLYYDQIFSYIGIGVLTALSMFAAGVYIFGMDRIYLEQEKSSHYHAQIMAYKMLEQQYSQQERLRHDLKNHLIVLSGLVENKEWGKIRNYISNMRESGSFDAYEEMSGNKAVDALLYQKRKEAEAKKIKWDCEVYIPPKCGINEFDLCVLFGNILDNAVEACERMMFRNMYDSEAYFISVQAKRVKKFFLLEVKNSVDKTEQFKTGFSNKEDFKGYGIGLLNVSDVVQRYHGVMNVEAQDGIFVASLLLPMDVPDMTAKSLFETGS
ncbi:MAG: GHKL domain-containing protein [Lachnospiraceae bacterium]|nr:GHKL domain-containing protein [Lachnospiraceae bacterium]MDE6184011.1 GHKL domain-containing protein [Lachnospiraceae bacterium]